ncbi:MAG: transposase [Vicingaceae bacterium]
MEEGKFYHIYNRGNNKENLFKEDLNYTFFLKQYDKYLSGAVDTYAYCLMPNHFHFLRVKELDEKTFEVSKTSNVSRLQLPPVIKGFKNFFTSYSKAINKKYKRTGSLFQYKFKRKEITSEEYLKNLVVYIHQNSVSDRFVNRTEDWKNSSYNTLVNDGQTKLKRNEVIEMFDDKENFIHCHQDYVSPKIEDEIW